jgi:RNA polymerase sigma-70 factor, ECF subfamily
MNGDKKQQTREIWELLRVRLRAFIMSKVHNEAFADDLLQDLFIKIHDNIDQLNDRTRMQPWVYQISRNLITDHFRKIKKETNYSPAINPLTEDIQQEEPENSVTEALRDMINMMDDLPPEYCEALCMTEIDGLSQKKYAAIKGISYSGAKSRIQRARKMLRDMLMKCCHYEFDKYGTILEIRPAGCCCCSG